MKDRICHLVRAQWRVSSYNLARASLVFVLAAGLSPPTRAAAPLDKNVTVNIAPGTPLDLAVAQLGQQITSQTSIQVMLASTSLGQQKTAGLNGTLSASDALRSLLDDSGLTYRLSDDTITIAPADGRAADAKSFRTTEAISAIEIPASESEGPSAEEGGGKNRETDESTRPPLAEVVVTGSHIRGVDNKTNPVIVIDNTQIERSGYSSTQELFRALPQNFSSGDASEDGYFGGNPNAAVNSDISSGVNLRGLGVSSTLVLLNGHRLAPSTLGMVVDVSLIPISAIDRLEILTDGSSAIYGSDAVGGVVNIVLKNDYQGAETAVHDGAVTAGSRREEQAAQTIGTKWTGGNLVATVQYQDKSALPARDRDFASALTTPNDLLPATRTYAATLNGQERIRDALNSYGDFLLSKRYFDRNTSFSQAPAGNYVTYSGGSTEDLSFTPGLRYSLGANWSTELNTLYSRQQSTISTQAGPPTVFVYNNTHFVEKSADLIINGKLGATSGGQVGLAFGASYRADNLISDNAESPGSIISISERRHIASEFAELYVPIVGKRNGLPLVDALEFSAAIRRDKYSDFGSTTNPRLGIRWAPWSDVSIRASYGTSFRAPTVHELYLESPNNQFILTYPFANPRGPGTVPVLLLSGSTALKPEKARTEDFGIEYKPAGLDGLAIELSFYNIRYTDRITIPPLNTNALLTPASYGSLISPVSSDSAAQTLIDDAVALGAQYYDITGTGATGVRYLYDYRQQNAALVRQSGFDLTPKFVRAIGAYTFSSLLNVSFIDKVDTAFASNAVSTNLVNTFGNPVRWRGRLDLALASVRWAIGGAVNGVGHYTNNVVAGTPPVGSWTTMDLHASIYADSYLTGAAWRGIVVSVTAFNLFNREPPYVSASGLGVPVTYDPANANPLNRFVSVDVKKRW